MDRSATAAVPPRMSLRRRGDALDVTWRWLRWDAFGRTLFALVTTVVAVAWRGELLRGGTSGVLLEVALAVAALVADYGALALWVNRTTISVDRQHVTVRHGPLPWRGGRTLEVRRVVQLWVEQRLHSTGRGRYPTYGVQARTIDGRDTLLLDAGRLDQALFVEREVERFLGLRDVPVEGQVDPATATPPEALIRMVLDRLGGGRGG